MPAALEPVRERLLELAVELGQLFTSPEQRTHWLFLVCAALVVAIVWTARGSWRQWREALARWWAPSARVDYLLILTRPIVFGLVSLPWIFSAFAVARAVVSGLDHSFGQRALAGLDPLSLSLLYTLALFLAWDFSRFLLHWCMHRFELLWAFHQVHHSAEVMTPLTLYRIHPLESLLYRLRGALVTGAVTGLFFHLTRGQAQPLELLGVNALGVVFSAVGGNLRHSHLWWGWGPLERWFISPAQHQLHHARDGGARVNYGTWLAIWDRMFSTLELSAEAEPPRFGLAEDERNHQPDSWLSALFDPIWAAGARLLAPLRGSAALILILGCPGLALAAPPAGEEQRDPPPNEEAPAGEGGVEGGVEAPPEFQGPTFVPPTIVQKPEPEPEVEPEPEPEPEAEPEQESEPEEPEPAEATAQADPAEGSEEGADEVRVINVSILDEELPRVVGSAHVVNEEKLERSEDDDIQRVLERVPGVYVRNEDGFGLRPNIGLRGVDPNRSSKVNLLEDGVLFGPAPYSAPAAYYFPMTTRLVGVEVFKGPAALRHGPNTIGGAVNLQTRSIPEESQGGIDLAGGIRGYGKAHGWWGRSWTYGGLMIEGVHVQNGGFKVLDGNEPSWAPILTGNDTGFARNEFEIQGRVNTRPSAAVYHQLDARLGFSTERSNETYLGLAPSDFEQTPYRRYAASQLALMRWWRTKGQLRYQMAALDGLVRLRVTGYRHDMSRAWRKFNSFRGGPDMREILQDEGGQASAYIPILRGEQDTFNDSEVLLIGTNDRSYVSQGVHALLTISPETEIADQVIEFGARLHADSIDRFHTEDGYWMINGRLNPEPGGETEVTTDNRGGVLAGAFHLYDAITLIDRITFAPGLRLELIDRRFANDLADTSQRGFDAVLLPGGGVHVFATSWLGFFGGVHTGFSPVSPGQPDEVRPERSVNYELGARVIRGGLHVEGTGFYTDYANLTGECTFAQGCDDANIGQQFNGGQVQVAGAELSAGYTHEFTLGAWLDVEGNYSYTWNSFRRDFDSSNPQWGAVEAGDALPYLPNHVFSGSLAGGMKRFGLNVGFHYNGQMRDLPGQGEVPDNERIPAYFVLDAGARFWVTERASLYVNGTNLTNARYLVAARPLGLRPGAPLSAMLGFKYAFGARG